MQIQSETASNQRYEKTATIKSKTSNFTDDEKKIRALVKQYNAVVQYEHNSGNKGSRELHLLIGISPDTLDSFYQSVLRIGLVRTKQITKVDKTNEYRILNAKKKSLENTLSSLIELEAKGGVISDYIALHDKILDIENQLQELGVELGNFDKENEFCTVKFSLYEGETLKGISLLQRIKIVFEWSVKYYAVMILSTFRAIFIAYIILLILDKLKIISTMISKIKDIP